MRKSNHKNERDTRVIAARLKLPVYVRLRAQADKEHRTMANLVAVFVQAGLDDRNRGARP